MLRRQQALRRTPAQAAHGNTVVCPFRTFPIAGFLFLPGGRRRLFRRFPHLGFRHLCLLAVCLLRLFGYPFIRSSGCRFSIFRVLPGVVPV